VLEDICTNQSDDGDSDDEDSDDEDQEEEDEPVRIALHQRLAYLLH